MFLHASIFTPTHTHTRQITPASDHSDHAERAPLTGRNIHTHAIDSRGSTHTHTHMVSTHYAYEIVVWHAPIVGPTDRSMRTRFD